MAEVKESYDLYEFHGRGQNLIKSSMEVDVVRSMKLMRDLLAHVEQARGVSVAADSLNDDPWIDPAELAARPRDQQIVDEDLYLDPVTSFAIENDGRGYRGEITIFVPNGFWGEFNKDSEKSLGVLVGDEGYRGDGPSQWRIDNAAYAAEDGVVIARWQNEVGKPSMVLHIRELESDMKRMSRGSINYENDLSWSGDITVPALTGRGIVEHATRNLQTLARDPDYRAAAQMAIYTGMAGPEDGYSAMQRTRGVSFNTDTMEFGFSASRLHEKDDLPDIKTKAGASLFVPEEEKAGLGDGPQALFSVFGVRPNVLPDIRKAAAEYVVNTIKPEVVPEYLAKETAKPFLKSVLSLGR